MLNNKILFVAVVAILLLGGLFSFVRLSKKTTKVTNSLVFTDKGHTVQFQYPAGATSTQIAFSENFKIQSLDARYGKLNALHAWYMMEDGIALFDPHIRQVNPHMTWEEYKNQQIETIQEDQWNVYSNIHEISLGGEKALTFDKTTNRLKAPVDSRTNKAWYPNSKMIQTIHNGQQYIIRFSSYDQAEDTDKSIASAYATFVSTFRFLK